MKIKKLISLFLCLNIFCFAFSKDKESISPEVTNEGTQETSENTLEQTEEIKSDEVEHEEKIIFTREDLLKQLEQNNAELNSLQEEYNQSLLDVKNAKAGRWPSIDLTVAGTYMVNPPMGKVVLDVDEVLNSINWPDSMRPAPTNDYITLFDGMENSLYNFQLQLTQPIFTWGKINNAVKLYEKVSDVKQIQIQSKQGQLNTELNTRLVGLSYLKEIISLMEKQDEYAKRLVKISEDAQKNGLLLKQDVLEAKISAKQIEIAMYDIQEQFYNLMLGIQKITGQSNLSINDIDFTPDENIFLDYAKLDRAQLEEIALSDYHDTFLMLKTLEEISGIATKISEASVYWKPDFALQMSLGYGGSRFPFVEKDWYLQDNYTANFTIALKTTVWDGGKKLNEIKRSQSKENVAALNYNDAAISIKQNLKEQFNTIDLSLARMEYQQLKMETMDSKIKQQEQLFQSGYGSEQDLIQAKLDRNTAEIELIKNKLSLAGACCTAAYLTDTDLFGDKKPVPEIIDGTAVETENSEVEKN